MARSLDSAFPTMIRRAVRAFCGMGDQRLISARVRIVAALVVLLLVLAASATLAGLHFLGSDNGTAKAGSPPPAASSAKGPVANETYQWRPVAIGAGGFISGLSFDDKGVTRVARTDVHGAYIWRPERDRWELLVTASTVPEEDRKQAGMNEGVYEIVVAPSDPDRIYMAVKGAVYHSSDRGAHWTRWAKAAPSPIRLNANGPFRFFGPFLAVDPTNPDLVLFGTPQDGVWRSADGGRNWVLVKDVPPSADMRPAPGVQAPGASLWFERGRGGKPTGRIWAAVPGHGVFVSKDKGLSFQPLTPPGEPAPQLLKRGVFAPDGGFFGVDSEGKKVWRFRDGHWTDLTEGKELGPKNYSAIAANPRDGTLYLFDDGGRTLRSTNGGDNWWRVLRRASVGKGDPPWLRIADNGYFATGMVAFDPVVPDRLWVAAGTGVFYGDAPTVALQLMLVSQSRGIEELVANDVVQPDGQSPVFAAWDFGIHVKDDLNSFSATYGPRERVLIAAQQLAWSKADPSMVVTNASDTRMGCCSEDGQSVLAGYSEDGGRTWRRFASLPTPPGTNPNDPWRMSFGMIAVAADDSANIIWAPSFDRSPFYTKDRGKTWARVELPGERLPKTGSHSAFYFQRKTLAADRVIPGVFYYVHSGTATNPQLQGLWRTADGGAHWDQVFKGEIAPKSQYAAKLRAAPDWAGHLFFTSGVAEGDNTRLRRSTDGGKTWTAMDGVDHVDDIAFGKAAAGAPYPTIFISGQVRGFYGIWRSVDAAKSWRRLADFPIGRLDQVTVLGADPNVFGRVYIGYMGSGWIYGEPAPCAADLQKTDAESQCVQVAD